MELQFDNYLVWTVPIGGVVPEDPGSGVFARNGNPVSPAYILLLRHSHRPLGTCDNYAPRGRAFESPARTGRKSPLGPTFKA